MKKRIPAFLLIILSVCMLFSSCADVTSRLAPKTEILLDKLSDESSFRVVSQNPTATVGGFMTAIWNINTIVGKRVFRMDSLNTENYTFDSALLEKGREYLSGKLKMTDKEFQDSYGGVICARYYKDVNVFVALKYKVDSQHPSSGATVYVIKQKGDSFERVEAELENGAFSHAPENFYRVGGLFAIAGVHYIVDLNEMTITKGDIAAPGGDAAEIASRCRAYLAATEGLENVAETIKDDPILTAKELEGKLWFAVKKEYASYSELYCLIFDAATGEALYAAVVSTPDVGDDPEQSRFVSSFVLAEPVLANGNGYYDIV